MSDPLTIGIGVGVVGALLVGLSQQQKTTIEVGKLSNRTFQGSEYGGDIPRVYGTVGLSGSQIVWMEKNQLKEVVKKKKSGGKGGASTVTKTYSYFATFALMLCQGEIAGIRRIWCSDKLIYNAGSDDLETIIASNQAAKGWKLYTGTDDQLPDPRYEADVGVGNAPAFRGYTYIAFYDFALADYSNTLQAAQFKIELISSATDALAYSVDVEQVSGVLTSSWSPEIYASPAMQTKDYPSGFGVSEYSGAPFVYSKNIYSGSQKKSLYIPPEYTPAIVPFSVAMSDGYEFAFNCNNKILITDAGQYNLAIDPPATSFRVVKIVRCGINEFALTQSPSGGGAARVVKVRPIDPDAPYDADGSVVGFISLGVYSAYNLLPAGDGFAVWQTGTPEQITIYDGDFNSLITFPTPAHGATSPSNVQAPGMPCCQASDGRYWRALIKSGGVVFQAYDQHGGYQEYQTGIFASLDLTRANGLSITFPLAYLYTGSDGNLNIFKLTEQADDLPTVGEVISREMQLSQLIEPGDIDMSLLTQQVRGYRVSGGAIRSVIEPIRGAYPFDIVSSGYKIKGIPRGQSSVMTIPWDDLAANDGSDIGNSLSYSREMDSQLPQKVTITALSSTREYASATQSYERLNTSAVNIEQRDIPLVLSDDEIAQMSEKLLNLRWLERDDFDGPVLPPTYLQLETADVVTVQAKFGTFELRLTEINYESDGRLTCKAKPNNAAIYTSGAAGAPGPGPSGTVGLPGATLWIPMDIPVVDETIQNEPGLSTAATGYTSGWPGSVVVRSNDNGQTYTEVQAYSGRGTIGYARGSLLVNSGALIDQSKLVVDLLDGELESVTQDQMIAGVNFAAYGADQRWEIVRFQNATLQTDGSYLLSGFIRGDKGTEWATGLHQQGDLFILLDDPDNIFISVPVESIGLERLYRGVTSGESIDTASDQAFTYRGVNLKPLSPAFAYSSRDSSSNLTVYAIRRSRYTNSWWVTGTSGPVGESTEAYEADVMSGGAVMRTLASTNGTFAYSAADQAADFGSAQANITLRIYQLSAVVGRGYPLEATL